MAGAVGFHAHKSPHARRADTARVCGILGMATVRGRHLDIPDAAIARLRDLMAHRGPDGAGLWRDGSIALAHRRLAVLDPIPAADQPMASADGRWVVVYNGELYNDADLRRDLEHRGVAFRTACDTETLVEALAAWGEAAVARLRGMYAFGAYDRVGHRLLLARDPLGIKPLYWWRGMVGDSPLLLFSSEVRPILEHPAVGVRPDLAALSAYLTTIRTTLGERTLFEGVRSLLPGQRLVLDLSGERPVEYRHDWWLEHAPPAGPACPVEAVRQAIEDSIAAHLRSDVPLCALLSGGLDSVIVAGEACRHVAMLQTFCAGAPGGDNDDLAWARRAAEVLGTRHRGIEIDRAGFIECWDDQIRRTGLPLSTPNEVAIRKVAAAIRQAGCVVALSGEGADELFAGYEAPVRTAFDFESRDAGGDGWSRRAAAFHVESNAWVPVGLKPVVLAPVARAAAEADSALLEHLRQELETLRERFGTRGLAAHLALHRRINLAGLLLRLDQATMLESVEGRTPMADQELCLLAESLPMDERFRVEGGVFEGKRILRRAFAPRLPERVLTRPKASFPLPFQDWMSDAVHWLEGNPWVRDIFSAEAIEAVRHDAGRLWRLAWPLLNLARWGRRWWG